ncbi:MAG: tetratricopeptide repeat protein [Microcoleaceae cyanobacterium MO_207.B10]|nr:tetratricopeptide repeat protein [Microcoleaceae cyanobacterium MO_207.B10]
MNEQRLTEYAQLIQQLLECPEGEELDILQNHLHLIDAGLIAEMQQYAQHLAEAGQKNNAQWLLNMAEKLTEWLNQSQKPVPVKSYITLVLQLIAAGLEDWGNLTPIYQVLDNNLHLLDENLARILPQYASFMVKEPYTDSIVASIENLSVGIYEFPRGDRKAQIEIAIAGYLFVLSNRQENTQYWAQTQNNLASAYINRIRGERAENLENAIAAFHLALSVYTKQDFPMNWATTQNNLATAYRNRIRGERAENLENAIAAYHLALSVRKPDTLPADCLQTARNLANLASKQENYQLAIDNYEMAITAIEQSRDWIPDEIARQEILRKNIYVYENMIQACVNAEQYDKALETVERFRCRRLLDLILTKDLYKNGEVPEDIRKLEAEMEEKQGEKETSLS